MKIAKSLLAGLIWVLKITGFIPVIPFIVTSAIVGSIFGLNEYYFQSWREKTKFFITNSKLQAQLEANDKNSDLAKRARELAKEIQEANQK